MIVPVAPRTDTATARDVDLRAVDLRDDARAAFDLVGADPSAALAAADSVIARIPQQGARREEHEAAALAHRVAGLALADIPDLHAAEARLRTAATIAARHHLDEAEGLAQMSLAFALYRRGRLDLALKATLRADAKLSGALQARNLVQRAPILLNLGRVEEALSAYDEGIPRLLRAGETLAAAKALHNRANLLAFRGDIAPALDDERRAVALYAELGMTMFEAQARSDLGWMTGLAGDIPGALRLMDDALAALPRDHVETLPDKADILLRAGLADEARATAETALAWLSGRDTGWEGLRAEVELTVAEACLAANDGEQAHRHARTAATMFRNQGRRPWVALATYVVDMATLRAQGEPAPGLLARIRSLETRGWTGHALDLRIAAASAHLQRGDAAAVRAVLGRPSYDAGAPIHVRSRIRHAQALAALARDERTEFRRRLVQAWEVTELERALLGATELQAVGARRANAVVQLGIHQAVREGSPSAVIAWAERGRAATLRFPSVLPPDDAALATALGRLRMLHRARRDDQLAERPGTADDLTRHERQVLRLTREAEAGGRALEPARSSDIRSALGDAVLVEYVASGAELVAVVIEARRSRLVPLGTLAQVTPRVDRMEFLLRRGASGHAASSPATAISFAAAAQQLDAVLVAPLSLPDRSRVVVVPTGPLWRIPWNVLPSLRGRTVSVAPSATSWLRSSARERDPSGSCVAVGGPALEHSGREARAVAAVHGGEAVEGAGATAEATLAALTSGELAHLAVHGVLRPDNPLFSSLELVDGPVMGYDLERLPRVPHTVVLPACHSGEGRSFGGDDMLGLAWTLLGAGAATVVAAITVVPDGATYDLMLRLHTHLAAGLGAAQSLARAQASAEETDPLATATAAAFVCLGA